MKFKNSKWVFFDKNHGVTKAALLSVGSKGKSIFVSFSSSKKKLMFLGLWPFYLQAKSHVFPVSPNIRSSDINSSASLLHIKDACD
jgi:hypothetical protein